MCRQFFKQVLFYTYRFDSAIHFCLVYVVRMYVLFEEQNGILNSVFALFLQLIDLGFGNLLFLARLR